MDDFRELLGADTALAYAPVRVASGWDVEFCHGAGMRDPTAFGWEIAEYFRASDAQGLAYYHPSRPSRAQRNRVLDLDDLYRTGKPLPAVARDLYPRFDLDRLDQLRVLVCDGPSMLTWLGAWREQPYTVRERMLFKGLVPAVRERLRLERAAGREAFEQVALDAALELFATPAWVVRWDGRNVRVLHANPAGIGALEARRQRVVERLRRTCASPGPAQPLRLLRLGGPGHGDLRLLVERVPIEPPEPRLAAASARWGLTARERQVLAMLAAGTSNRTIGDALKIASRTVEAHVTAVLRKADVGSRSELVARFWSEPLP
ncbi:MAG: helix-turn-helix transcriptional regulator [Myxococcota bacterium]